MANQSPLDNVESWRECFESPSIRRLFSGLESFRWWLRDHREKLTTQGVLFKHRGQWHVIRPEFDQAVIRIMQDQTLTTQPHGMDELAQAA